MSLISRYIIFIFILFLALNCDSKKTKKVKARKEDSQKFKVVTVSNEGGKNNTLENLTGKDFAQENKGTVKRPFYLLLHYDDYDHVQNPDADFPLLQGTLPNAIVNPRNIFQNHNHLSI